jgi:hypothetical protein
MQETGSRSAVQRVGTTPEAHARWLIDLAYRRDAVVEPDTSRRPPAK